MSKERKLVYLDEVKKLYYKQHLSYDFDNNTEVIQDDFEEKLNNLDTVTPPQDEFKVGDEIYGINEYEEVVWGVLTEKDYIWEHIEGHLVVDEEIANDCRNIYKTRELAEQALEYLKKQG